MKKKRLILSVASFSAIIILVGTWAIWHESRAGRQNQTPKSKTENIVTVTSEQMDSTETANADTTMPASQLVSNIRIGWNLGNALESASAEQGKWENLGQTKETYYETLSGNPKTTKTMIDKIAGAGYSAVRIPVTYTNHIDEAGNIDKAWLDRVAEVAGYVLDDGMYCIIDVHHDVGQSGWLIADLSDMQTGSSRFQKIWTQIADYFKSYSDSLIFEGYNEILDKDQNWSNPSSDSLAAANQLNQIFVDTVRSTGGGNSTRNLLVNTYAAKAESYILNGFAVPADVVENHLIVGVHIYDPEKASQNALIENLNQYFIKKQIPVMIGEYATPFQTPSADRIISAKNLINDAKQYHIPVFWWDDGNYKKEAGAQCKYALLDRVALEWYDSDLVKEMISAAGQ